MSQDKYYRIALMASMALLAGGCAGLSTQHTPMFPGYHAADGVTPAIVERNFVPREEIEADIRGENLGGYRYRGRYGVTGYDMLSHIYGPYAHLSWRDRHYLEYQRRLGRIGYGQYYDPFYDPFGFGGQRSYWGSAWYDPWGGNYYWYADPYYYSSSYYGYSYSRSRYGPGFYGYGYTAYSPVYGGTFSKGTTANKRRGRNRRNAGSSWFATVFDSKETGSVAKSSRGSSSRGSSRSSSSGSVRSGGRKATSSGDSSGSSSGKSNSRRSKRKN